MVELIFIGCGAVAAEICSYIKDINKKAEEEVYVVKGFLDDSEESYISNAAKYGYDAPFLGAIGAFEFSNKYAYAFGFASIAVRRKFIDQLASLNLEFPTIIHPSVIIDNSAVLGKGNVLYPNTIVGPGVSIGEHNLITSYSFISHDCKIGHNNFFSTAGLAGNVFVENDNFMGIRSTIIPSIKMGSNNVIQAGMIVSNDVTNNETVFYKYKEKIMIIKS